MKKLKISAIIMALVLLAVTIPVCAGTADEEEKDYLEGVHLVYLGADYFAGEGADLAAEIAEREAGTFAVDALEGACIAGDAETTYASRAQNLEQLLNTGEKIKNMLIVELTDNDLETDYTMGEWDYVYDAGYDTGTIIGALDSLFEKARNLEMTAALLIPAGQDNPDYPGLVEAAEELQEKWGYVMIDLRETEGQDTADSVIAQIRPFLTVMRGSYKNMFKYAGNLPQFDPANYETDPESPLKGLNIIQLGSSVTEGTGSDEGISFVEYIAQMTGSTYVKESVPGTTMSNYAPLGDTYYIYRMEHNIDPDVHADLFLCQLSTNDASKRVEVGEASASDDPADFNLETVAGAAEYIIRFVQDTWNCPVMFYTGTEYGNAAYGDMVEMLLSLQDKYDIGIIDMYHNLSTDTVLYNQYMSPDGIHPTKRGYAEWWAPYMIEQITEYLGSSHKDGDTAEETVINDVPEYLWELSPDMDDEEFSKLSIRNFKFVQSIEPLVDPVSYNNLYKASVHVKQKKEDAKQEFIDAQNNLILKTSVADGVYFLWDADNMPIADGEEYTEEELDEGPLDSYGFIPLLVKCLLEDPTQAKGNLIVVAGGGMTNRSNGVEAYPAIEVFNDLGYNVFVLQRRIRPYSNEDIFMDMQRAIRMVRYYAAQEGWGGQDMIAACGWSGGASTVMGAVNNLYGDLNPTKYCSTYIPDEIDAVNSDTDVTLPIYGGAIAEDCENPHIPALFCCLGTEDQNHPVEEYTANPYQAALDRGAPATIFIIEGAGHGFGVGQEGATKSVPECALWPGLADEFMQANRGYSENAAPAAPAETSASASIDINSETGSVTVEYYDGSEILQTEEDGNILVQVPEGTVLDDINIYAAGGEIDIIGVIAAHYDLETVHDDMNVYLPADQAFHVQLVTISDLFESDFLYDVTMTRHEYIFGEDGVDIEMETIIGTARVMILS